MDPVRHTSAKKFCGNQDVRLLVRAASTELPFDQDVIARSIANLLHVHLGVDDDSEGSGNSRDARSKEKTAAEQFHSFRDVHTAGWHKRRDEVAQACESVQIT